jgi:hypothetical protein
MQTAWLIFRISSLNHPGWQRRRGYNLGIPCILVRNSGLRLLIFYESQKKMWN